MNEYSPEFARSTSDTLLLPRTEEETLVADRRAALTPSEQVEQKLIGLLRMSPLLMGHTQRRLRPGPR